MGTGKVGARIVIRDSMGQVLTCRQIPKLAYLSPKNVEAWGAFIVVVFV